MKRISSMPCLGLLAALALTLAAPAAAHQGGGHAYGLVKQDLKLYFQTLADARAFSGAVLVARDGKILLERGYGMADYEQGIRNRRDTVYAVASFTKAFAAMSIMMLAERGQLDVDDPVAEHIPGFPNGEVITIRHLLNQTSGLYEYLLSPDLWASFTLAHTPMELLDYFVYEPLGFTPGSQHQYSNSNYVTLGVIIENVSGLPFRDFIRLNILDPLEMDHTSYDPFELDFPDKAIGYDDITADPPVPTSIYAHPTIPYSAGGMASTVEDLYRWDQALYTETLVSAATLEEMFTPGHGDYGFGWYIDELVVDGQPHKQIWHWGSFFGLHGYISRLVDDRVTIIIQLNISPVSDSPEELRPMAEDVAAIVFSHD
ncbi:MAG: beta-lactamase family protein [bacterium]|nr:beta-lactamase family protein [bacterium]